MEINSCVRCCSFIFAVWCIVGYCVPLISDTVYAMLLLVFWWSVVHDSDSMIDITKASPQKIPLCKYQPD